MWNHQWNSCPRFERRRRHNRALSERILGRTTLEDFIEDGKVLVKAGTMIKDNEAKIISDSNVESIRIRSVLTCESLRSLC